MAKFVHVAVVGFAFDHRAHLLVWLGCSLASNAGREMQVLSILGGSELHDGVWAEEFVETGTLQKPLQSPGLAETTPKKHGSFVMKVAKPSFGKP
ncbi:MAG: hypothetical protein AB1440_00560 [Pseudomonadota bacterium]|jgi:hypothetical protein